MEHKTPYANRYARLYDLLYADKDYATEVTSVRTLLNGSVPGARNLLELGSGTGRHANEFAASGYLVYGVERSETMLAIAKSNAAPGCNFSLGDLRTFRIDRKFDAVLSLFHVMSYQTSNKDFADALETARVHLNPGGVFLFDFWYGPAVLHNKPSVRIKRVSDDSVEITRQAQPALLCEANVVVVDYHLFIRDNNDNNVTECDEQHRVRYFFVPEMELFLSEAGFRLEKCEEWLSGGPLSLETWYGVCLARAI
jgi:SAM-dependent methyltransferase